MFTGITECTGTIDAIEARGGDLRMAIDGSALDLSGLKLGDSIAVSGVCLTVVERSATRLAFDVSVETLDRTSLGKLRVGGRVNLEQALRLSDRLGGHLVSGHVDGVGTVLSIRDDGRAQRWTFGMPGELSRYVAEKGSICVDGVSLTVNGVDAASFHVALIPHTVAVTTFRERSVGDAVNIEVDLIARYLERMGSRK